jgi:membrane-associated protein
MLHLLAVNWLDPKSLVENLGTPVLLLLIFLESGIFPAPLPGDSLLVLMGAFSATKANSGDPHFNLAVVLIGSFVVAVLGAQIGYWIGKFYGVKLFKPDAKIFKTAYLERAHEFFDRRGAGAVVIGRFIPVVRTVVPVVAGTGRMEGKRFFIANVIGAALWVGLATMLGFSLGKTLNIDKYVYPIVALIIIASLIPPFLEYRKHKREQRAAAES